MSLRDHLLSQGWTDADDIVAEVERYRELSNPLLARWTLPWPPTNNTYYRNITIKGQARTIISARGRAYSETVAKLMLGKAIVPGGAAMAFHVLCYPPDRRTRDLGNLDKALMDSLAKAKMFRNDFDIWDQRFTREVLSSPPGRVVVEVRQHLLADEKPTLQLVSRAAALSAVDTQAAQLAALREPPESLIPQHIADAMLRKEMDRPVLNGDYEKPLRQRLEAPE